jgi:hypothetical protein
MSRHRALSPLITLLAMTTTVALFSGGWVLATSGVADSGPVATERVVRDFYSAVNETIRTGDSASLDKIVAENVVTHGSLAKLVTDRTGLTRYLASLHATRPQLELIMAEVVVTADRAIVTVLAQGAAEGAFLGSSLRGVTPWGTVDAFRVSNHRVSEFWSGTVEPVLLESLAHAPFAVLDPPDRTITLDRLTIPAGGSYTATGAEEQRWLHVESGRVSAISTRLERSKAMLLVSEGETAKLEMGSTEQRNPAPLEAGDLVALPIWSQTEIRNIGPEPSSLLVLAAGFPASSLSGSDPARQSGKPPADVVEGWPGWSGGASPVSESGAMLASLTGKIETTLPGDRTVIAMARATLAPGAVVPTFATGPHLLTVDAGMLNLITEGEPAWVYQGSGSNLNLGALGPGAGALLPEGAVANLRNQSAEPVVVTILAILPGDVFTGSAM